MSNSILTFPESPEEYIHGGEYYLKPSGQWVFGLPATPQSTSSTCGALPFRSGTGLCSPNCLRGEDWVFMWDWAVDRYNLPNSMALDPWLYHQGPFNVISSGPSRQQLSNMVRNLTELKEVWGTNFTLSNQPVIYGNVNNVLLGSLDRNYALLSHDPPAIGNIPLELSRIQNFFTDMSMMKCTYGSARHDGNSRMAKDLYFWSKYDSHPDASESQYYIESMQITGVSNYVTRPLAFDAQFIGLFYAWEYVEDGYGTQLINDGGYALFKLGGKTTITQNFNAQSGMQWSIPCSYGGSGLAGDIAGLLGLEINPTVPQNGYASFSMSLQYLYVVVWPKYLQL